MSQACRGGAYWSDQRIKHCTVRYGNKPGLRFDISGFRIGKRGKGQRYVLRGGSWPNNHDSCFRCGCRNDSFLADRYIVGGFRIGRRKP